MYKQILILLLIYSFGLGGCSRYLKPTATVTRIDYSSNKATYKPRFHRVNRGETLYSIAWYYGHDYRELARWNDIDYPYLIKPGQLIHLNPQKALNNSQKSRSANPKRTIKLRSYRHSASKNTKKSPQTKPVTSKKRSSKQTKTRIRWQWPTQGKLISGFTNRTGKKGLEIAGKRGQHIYAAAAGRVVYSGSGLRGYGKLIIIKHNDTYLSAYAHNQKIRVKEQQKVKSGQHIADMGMSGTNKPILHFEIRRNGKPVNPIRYLPRRR